MNLFSGQNAYGFCSKDHCYAVSKATWFKHKFEDAARLCKFAGNYGISGKLFEPSTYNELNVCIRHNSRLS